MMKDSEVGCRDQSDRQRREVTRDGADRMLRRGFVAAAAAAAAGIVLPGCGESKEKPAPKRPGKKLPKAPSAKDKKQQAKGKAEAPLAAAAAAQGLPRWAMVIDLRRCIGCRGCTVACKAEFDVPLGKFSCVVRQKEVGKYPTARKVFLPTLCNHCTGADEAGPPCVKECPQNSMARARYVAPDGSRHRYRTGATYRRPDGAVLLDLQHCTGCGKCIKACPYGVRWAHPGVKASLDKTKQAVGKCTFCAHRIEKGLLPACVNVCEGKARIFGDLNDAASPVSKLVKEFGLDKKREAATLLPGEGTLPHVFYIDPAGDIAKVHQKGQEYKDEVF